MAIFAAGTEQTTAVGTSATKIFDTTNSAFATGATLTNLTVLNEGPDACYVGIASVTATGLLLNKGDQLVIEGYSYETSDTDGDRYAICASGDSATVVAGLATTVANV